MIPCTKCDDISEQTGCIPLHYTRYKYKFEHLFAAQKIPNNEMIKSGDKIAFKTDDDTLELDISVSTAVHSERGISEWTDELLKSHCYELKTRNFALDELNQKLLVLSFFIYLYSSLIQNHF